MPLTCTLADLEARNVISPADFFLMDLGNLPFDLFRGGNASGFQFHEERALKDCIVYPRDGVQFVSAANSGFSCFDHLTPRMRQQGRNVWKLRKGAMLPEELRLVKDQRRGHEGHYMLVPMRDMPVYKYVGLIQELERDPSKCVKLTPEEIRNGQ
jgi:hypothetical protein